MKKTCIFLFCTISIHSVSFGISANEVKAKPVDEKKLNNNLAAPYSIIRENFAPDGSGDDDFGAEEDDSQLTQSGVPCSSPECLGQIDYSQVSSRATGNITDTVSVLIQSTFGDYSNSTAVQNMISAARSNIRTNPNRYIVRVRGRRPRTYCYRAVKDALRSANMVPNVFNGSGFAYNGVTDLKSVGFKNLLENPSFSAILANKPELAPKGAILIYDTPRGSRANSAGHSEIKTEPPGTHGYISVSESRTPTYGYRIPQERRLIGVMIK